jgi:hypothetical protein
VPGGANESERRTRRERVDPRLRASGWEILPFDERRPLSRFTAHSIGSDPLSICEQLERFANDQCLPEHATMEEATEIVRDQFKRTVRQALETIELRCECIRSTTA